MYNAFSIPILSANASNIRKEKYNLDTIWQRVTLGLPNGATKRPHYLLYKIVSGSHIISDGTTSVSFPPKSVVFQVRYSSFQTCKTVGKFKFKNEKKKMLLVLKLVHKTTKGMKIQALGHLEYEKMIRFFKIVKQISTEFTKYLVHCRLMFWGID